MTEKIKENIFVFYIKRKRYRYEDELGLNKIRQPFPGNGARNDCWYLNAYRNNPQAHGITIVALHPEVFRVSYFP